MHPTAGGDRAGPAVRAAAPLPLLASIGLRASAALVGLYALLALVLALAVDLDVLGPVGAASLGVAVAGAQLALGPSAVEWALGGALGLRWLDPAELPAHLRAFAEGLCARHGLRFPRFAVIAGPPQALTYGRGRRDARVVLSEGLFRHLEPAELEAVVAHELGHVAHRDVLLMTAANLVPLVLYELAWLLGRSRLGCKGNGGLVLLAAYAAFVASRFGVLWMSRSRECRADRFAGEATGDPRHLARALVKIAHGWAAAAGEGEEGDQAGQQLAGVGALGIFDAGAARAVVLAARAAPPSGQAGSAAAAGALRWELWNPWSRWYELRSTHPTVARRLHDLADQARHMGLETDAALGGGERQPESFWDEFLLDLAVDLLPVAGLLGGIALVIAWPFGEARPTLLPAAGIVLASYGGGALLRLAAVYRGRSFPPTTVEALLAAVEVSPVRPVPCTLRGRIVGLDLPGRVFEDDLLLRDGTGTMLLELRGGLGAGAGGPGAPAADGGGGAEVEVTGWYRRALVPYVEVRSLAAPGGDARFAGHAAFRLGAAAVCLASGGVLVLLGTR